MDNDNVIELAGRGSIKDPITDLLRSGAQKLLKQAIEAELTQYLQQFDSRCYTMVGPLLSVMAISRKEIFKPVLVL